MMILIQIDINPKLFGFKLKEKTNSEQLFQFV